MPADSDGRAHVNKTPAPRPGLRQRLVTFLKYSSVSLTAAAIDLGIFMVVSALMRGHPDTARIWCATGAARLVSCTYNYILTNRVVFRSREAVKRTLPLFVALCAVQACCSALLVLGLTRWTGLPSALVKPVVDTALFLVAYRIQKKWIF